MNNLTNEERARIFAMYLNSKVHYKDRIGTIVSYYLASGDRTRQAWFLSLEDENFEENELSCSADLREAKLQLFPLNAITDEHAIEVAKIWGSVYHWEVRKRSDYAIVVSDGHYKVHIPRDHVNGIIRISRFCGDAHTEIWEEVACHNQIDIIDRLRELGYALPYKGKCLFELGVAIDVTTLNK